MTTKELQAMTTVTEPRQHTCHCDACQIRRDEDADDRRAEIDRLRDQAAARHSTMSPIDAIRHLYGDEAVVRGMRKLLAGGRNQRGIE